MGSGRHKPKRAQKYTAEPDGGRGVAGDPTTKGNPGTEDPPLSRSSQCFQSQIIPGFGEENAPPISKAVKRVALLFFCPVPHFSNYRLYLLQYVC